MDKIPQKTGPLSGPLIILVLVVPPRLDHNLLLPENNFIATGILARRIELELKHAGQMTEAPRFGGPLNQSMMLFPVRDAHKSAQMLQEILTGHAIPSCFVNIFLLDKSEMILRRLHPPGGRDMRLENLDEVINAGKALNEAMRKQVWEFINRPKPPESDNRQPPAA